MSFVGGTIYIVSGIGNKNVGKVHKFLWQVVLVV